MAETPTGQDPLQESLDELARVADSLVDDLTVDDPADDLPEVIEEPAEDAPTESRRASIRETLDALDQLIEEPSAPPISVEVEFDGDRGDDISEQLDALLTTDSGPGEATIAATDAEVIVPSEPALEQPATAAVTSRVVRQTATAVPDGTRRLAPTIAWMLAVVVLFGAAAGIYRFLQAPAEVPTVVAETPMPNPLVVFTKEPHQNPELPSADRGPIATAPVAIPPAVASAEKTPARPDPPAIEPVVEPTTTLPDDATVAYAAPPPEPVIEEAPLASIGASLFPAPAEMPAPTTTTESIVATLPPVADEPEPIAIETARVAAEPVELPQPVVVPADQPPVLVDRVEPVFDTRAIRRGETQTVVLRVLVNESGRVARVVVDESVQGAESEAAAINAVLRWTYEPAIEDGVPVRRWMTERFEFSRRPR